MVSPSLSIRFKETLRGRFGFEAGTAADLQTASALETVRQVTFELVNVRIVELAVEEVFRRAMKRNEFCDHALADRRDKNAQITMIQSAIVADGHSKRPQGPAGPWGWDPKFE